jgi:hypothetical protein
MAQVQSLTRCLEAIDKLRHEFGLDKPIMVQYIVWLSGILKGDFGTSIFYREKVGRLMLERFPVTLHLGLLAWIIGDFRRCRVVCREARNGWISGDASDLYRRNHPCFLARDTIDLCFWSQAELVSYRGLHVAI